jgi:hypothetical protein
MLTPTVVDGFIVHLLGQSLTHDLSLHLSPLSYLREALPNPEGSHLGR